MNHPGRLHVITSESLQSRLSHAELALCAARAGADVVQYREKREWGYARRVSAGIAARESCDRFGAALVVDDRVDVAAAVGARGVHLGRGDETPALARRRLGALALIGATANSLKQALQIDPAIVDYLGVGPVFGTVSKPHPAPALGLQGLARIVDAVDLPVIAIGGITVERVEAVLACGAHGIAVLSAVVADPDPAGATERFAEAVRRSLGSGGERARRTG